MRILCQRESLKGKVSRATGGLAVPPPPPKVGSDLKRHQQSQKQYSILTDGMRSANRGTQAMSSSVHSYMCDSTMFIPNTRGPSCRTSWSATSNDTNSSPPRPETVHAEVYIPLTGSCGEFFHLNPTPRTNTRSAIAPVQPGPDELKRYSLLPRKPCHAMLSKQEQRAMLETIKKSQAENKKKRRSPTSLITRGTSDG